MHILPTIRLRTKKDDTYSLVLTRYKEVPTSTEDNKRISKEKKREEQILKRNGYYPDPDMWAIIWGPITKKPTAYISDFGNIRHK